MQHEDQLPVQSAPTSHRPMQRHLTARYYARWVQEFVITRVCKFVCAIFLGLLLFLGIVSFILWLGLRPRQPKFHIRDFSVLGLAQRNWFSKAQVSLNVTVRNPNQNIGIYYDATRITVNYKERSIGGAKLPFPFYQRPEKTTMLHSSLSGPALLVNRNRWIHFLGDRSRGEVIFRVDVLSTVRFKIFSWRTERHKMHANCEVGVGPDGMILQSYQGKRCPVYFT